MIRSKFSLKLKAILFLLGLGLFTLNYSHGYAQLGQLKGKLKGKTKKENTESSNKKKANKENVAALVYDQTFAPGLVYHSFLKHAEFRPDGIFSLQHVSIAFLPGKDENGAEVDYEKPARFHTILKKDGVEIFDRYYVPQYKFKIYTKFAFDIQNKNGNVEKSDSPLELGNYVLEFYLDDKLFAKYPFEIENLKNNDPYAETTEKRFAKGMWEDYGYFKWEEKPSKGEEPRLYWHDFKILKDLTANYKYKKANYELYKNGKYFAKTYDLKRRVKDEWSEDKCVFFKTATKSEKISSKNLIRKNHLTDGKYELKAFMGDDKKLTATYKFEVSGGKILPTERQKRDKVDPSDFIENLNQTFWVKKQ